MGAGSLQLEVDSVAGASCEEVNWGREKLVPRREGKTFCRERKGRERERSWESVASYLMVELFCLVHYLSQNTWLSVMTNGLIKSLDSLQVLFRLDQFQFSTIFLFFQGKKKNSFCTNIVWRACGRVGMDGLYITLGCGPHLVLLKHVKCSKEYNISYFSLAK